METVFFEKSQYRISFDPMQDSLMQKLPKNALKHYLELLEKVQTTPKEIYEEVKGFCEKHQNVPEVANLLTFAHIQNFKVQEAEALIEKTYNEHPNYLFARINFADQCLRKKNLEKIPEIFPTFDLHELYPEKESFHCSEFRGFMVMLGFYHLALDKKEAAMRCLEAAKQVAPDHQGVIYLEKKLSRQSLLRRLLRALHLRQ